MSTTFAPERQLVYEWYTPSLEKSIAFLQAFGFMVLRREEAFAELSYGRNRLLVEQMQEDYNSEEAAEEDSAAVGYRGYHGNLRILVDNVDAVYQSALLINGCRVLKELGDWSLRPTRFHNRWPLRTRSALCTTSARLHGVLAKAS